MEPYQEGKDWSTYAERLDQYIASLQLTDETIKMATFITVIGETVYSVLRNSFAPVKPKDKTLPDLMRCLNDHYCPKPLVISERFNFYQRAQKEQEPASVYLVELRKLAEHCEFGGFLDEALRDKFVMGLWQKGTQKKLLSEADLTLDRALKVAVGDEMAEKGSEKFHQCQNTMLTTKVCKVSRQTYGKNKP